MVKKRQKPITTGAFPVRPIGTHVYRAFGWQDRLLYVGVTDELCTRLAAHRANSSWWPLTERITWEEYLTRDDALEAESAAIFLEDPEYNVMGKRYEPA